jgi:hypothetical protein
VTAGANRIKRKNLSERSEFIFSPDLCLLAPGTPKGLRPSGRLLLLTFLGEARKVSGCRATPGKVDQRKNNISNNEREVGTKHQSDLITKTSKYS